MITKIILDNLFLNQLTMGFSFSYKITWQQYLEKNVGISELREHPGSLVIRTSHWGPGFKIQSLVRELRSHKPQMMQPKETKKSVVFLYTRNEHVDTTVKNKTPLIITQQNKIIRHNSNDTCSGLVLWKLHNSNERTQRRFK